MCVFLGQEIPNPIYCTTVLYDTVQVSWTSTLNSVLLTLCLLFLCYIPPSKVSNKSMLHRSDIYYKYTIAAWDFTDVCSHSPQVLRVCISKTHCGVGKTISFICFHCFFHRLLCNVVSVLSNLYLLTNQESTPVSVCTVLSTCLCVLCYGSRLV